MVHYWSVMGHLICSLIMAVCLLGTVALFIKTIDSALAKRKELQAFKEYQDARRRKDREGVRRALREAEKALRRQW